MFTIQCSHVPLRRESFSAVFDHFSFEVVALFFLVCFSCYRGDCINALLFICILLEWSSLNFQANFPEKLYIAIDATKKKHIIDY